MSDQRGEEREKKWQTDNFKCGRSYPDVVEGCFVSDVIEQEES